MFPFKHVPLIPCYSRIVCLIVLVTAAGPSLTLKDSGAEKHRLSLISQLSNVAQTPFRQAVYSIQLLSRASVDKKRVTGHGRVAPTAGQAPRQIRSKGEAHYVSSQVLSELRQVRLGNRPKVPTVDPVMVDMHSIHVHDARHGGHTSCCLECQ